MGKKEIEKITKQYSQNPVTMKIERVAAYVRVSSLEQKLHGVSLDAQRMKLTEYAETNNMRIVEWYVDEGVSGRKLIKNRPELQRMIQDAEQGKFDRIIFIKLDRFFRSVAEYHECMKRISPVLWSTTEEEYDLTTANGRMLVNMKLTIAEMEADMTGERIAIVNDYKLTTGQPLSGSMPYGFKIAIDEKTGRKKVIRDPETEPILRDVIDFFLLHQNKRKTLVYMNTKYNAGMGYNSLSRLFENPMLCGAYRDNPSYCEAYIDRETFEKLQQILKQNVKENTAENRAYLFSGLLRCPCCGLTLKGYIATKQNVGGMGRYKKYRCAKAKIDGQCTFNKVASEKTVEKLMLANIEKYLEKAKIRAATISNSEDVIIQKDNIEEIHARIDRLNYSWQTGKIRTVEQYEKDYAVLMDELEKAETEQGVPIVQDFSKIEAILQDGWKAIYNSLDDAHKRAFWRSFVKSIEINWTTEKKEIVRVNFF